MKVRVASFTRSDHVWLQEGSFKVDVMVAESLVDGGEDALGDFLANFDGVITVDEDFGLDNGDESFRLADRSVSSEDIGVLEDA